MLPLFIGLATLNALASILSGYANNLPPDRISRVDAAIAAVFFAAGAALSPSFKEETLSIVDRLAFLAYASSICWSVVDRHVLLPVQLGAGTLCLFAAWVYDDLRSR
jgi:hypothetical protein